MIRAIIAFIAMIIFFGPVQSSRAGYDAAANFSASSNPNGVWAYGQAPTLGGAFSLYTTHGNVGGIDYWNVVGGGLTPPEVFHNGTSQAITYSTIVIQPGQLAFHPGPQDQYSVIQFTAPTAGTFSLNSSFTGIDVVGTTTDVHVLLNGNSLYSSLVNGFGTTVNFNTTITLHQGDILDFEVGYGSNGNYFSDSTALSARINPLTAVPEPSSIILLMAGLTGASLARRRRKIASSLA